MKIYNSIRQLKLLIWLIIFGQNSIAQTTLQVATKHIEKNFSGSQILNIEAEKADIELIIWEKQEIKVEIELISKHIDRKIATNDLETMKYVADKINKEVFLRNYLLIQNEKVLPTSNLKIKYTIRIPIGMRVKIQNSFGKILVKGNTKHLFIKSDFCIIYLNDVDGKIELNTHYGEINCKEINGISIFNSERSDLIISRLGGECSINSQYGTLKFASFANLKNLTIDAKKSDISFDEISLQNHCFNLRTKFGKMTLPRDFSWVENDNISKAAVFNSTHPSKINVNNSFGNITINN